MTSSTYVLLGGPDDGTVLTVERSHGYVRDVEYWGGGTREHEPHTYLASFEEDGVLYFIHVSEANV